MFLLCLNRNSLNSTRVNMTKNENDVTVDVFSISFIDFRVHFQSCKFLLQLLFKQGRILFEPLFVAVVNNILAIQRSITKIILFLDVMNKSRIH